MAYGGTPLKAGTGQAQAFRGQDSVDVPPRRSSMLHSAVARPWRSIQGEQRRSNLRHSLSGLGVSVFGILAVICMHIGIHAVRPSDL